MKKTTFTATLLALSMGLSLCACDNNAKETKAAKDDEKEETAATTTEETVFEEDETTETTQATESTESEPEVTENVVDIDTQISVIENNKDMWLVKENNSDYLFSVTDYDHNGRLEINFGTIQGSAYCTSVKIYEVNETLDGLIECNMTVDDSEGFLFPDMITDVPVRCFTDGESYIYFFGDLYVVSDTSASYYMDAFSFAHSFYTFEDIASTSYEVDGQTSADIIKSLESDPTYNRTIDALYGDLTESKVIFKWIDADQVSSSSLKESYESFSAS